MGDGVWTRMGRGRCSCDLQATTATRRWWVIKSIIWFNTAALLLTGFQYYSDSPFGKPHRFTIFFSSVRCIGNEARITDCATNNLTFEEGKKLVDHIGVAGVSCKRHCDALTSSACPSVKTITACSRTSEIRPSQQVQSASSSSTDSGHVITIFLLAGISGTLATVTVTLAVW